MKKHCLLLALCLMLSICTACSKTPAETTAPSLPPVTAPQETVPPVTEPLLGNGKFTMELPKGFVETENSASRWVYLSPNAPEDHSLVSVELVPMDEEILSMSTAEYKQRIDVTLTGTSQAKRFKLIDLWQEDVDGFPAVVSEYNLVYDDYISHIYRYEIVCKGFHYVFTFDDASDGNDWLEHFSTMIDSVKLAHTEGGTELNFSEMTEYTLDCGLHLFAEAGLMELEAYGFRGCLGSRNCILLFLSDDKQANNLADMRLEDYAQLLRQNNDLDAFSRDAYNNLYTSFRTTDEDGNEYYNMLFLKETEGAFWVCQMACPTVFQESYQREFPLWASSITQG
ncbi:MAG: hypothetical protein IJ960_01480 [Oscillospiraceae bacterium]|nr:hypothetical protein [Oscillospiraceae bacterium]